MPKEAARAAAAHAHYPMIVVCTAVPLQPSLDQLMPMHRALLRPMAPDEVDWAPITDAQTGVLKMVLSYELTAKGEQAFDELAASLMEYAPQEIRATLGKLAGTKEVKRTEEKPRIEAKSM